MYEQIKKQAKNHIGLEFSAREFNFSFGSIKFLNQLVKDKIVQIVGEYPNNGNPIKKHRIVGCHPAKHGKIVESVKRFLKVFR